MKALALVLIAMMAPPAIACDTPQDPFRQVTVNGVTTRLPRFNPVTQHQYHLARIAETADNYKVVVVARTW